MTTTDRYSHPYRRTLDGRTAAGRRRKAILSALAKDLGGKEAMTPGQQIIIGQLDVKLATIDALRAHIEKQASLIGEDGDLLPSLRRAFLGYSNSVARDVALLHGLKGARKKKVPSLAEYLADKKAGQ